MLRRAIRSRWCGHPAGILNHWSCLFGVSICYRVLSASPNGQGTVHCPAHGRAVVRRCASAHKAQLGPGRRYPAESAAGTEDPAALAGLAAAQEVYGERAPEAYAHLASVLDKKSPERLHALERGFSLALRDGNLDQAGAFAASLDAEGHPEYRELLGEKRAVHDDALIPGGLDAFAVIANVKQGTPSEQFFANYARQVVANVCANNCMGDRYTATIQSYFAAITELEGLGNRDGNHVTVVLSLNGNDNATVRRMF